MLKLGPRLRHGHPVLLDQIFGTRQAGEIEAALHALPLPVVRCFHLELSVGALFGLELAGGTRVALKVHQPRAERLEELEVQQAAQTHLARRGFPCPLPVLGPTPFLGGLATAEEWRMEGRRFGAVSPARRRSMARALAWLIELGRELGPLPALEAYRWPEGVWPKPHNALFDFEGTKRGAEEIDEIGRRANDRMHAGPIVLAHQDWSLKHFRFGPGGAVTVVYDWDSLSIDYESIAIGGAAATQTAALRRSRSWRPRVANALAFVDEYEAERGPLGEELRRASLARIVYMTAYTARCEHTLAARGTTSFVTDTRSVLSDFASELLA